MEYENTPFADAPSASGSHMGWCQKHIVVASLLATFPLISEVPGMFRAPLNNYRLG